MRGPKLEIDIITQLREQWRIVRFCLFVIIGYSLVLVGDSRCGMGHLMFWKGFLDVLGAHRLS